MKQDTLDDVRALLRSAPAPDPTALFVTWKRLEASVGSLNAGQSSTGGARPTAVSGVRALLPKLLVLVIAGNTLGTPQPTLSTRVEGTGKPREALRSAP